MTLIIINTSTGEKDIGTRVGDARGGARSPAVSPNGHTETKGRDYSGERLEGKYKLDGMFPLSLLSLHLLISSAPLTSLKY